MKARSPLYGLLGVVVLISIGCGTVSSATSNSGTGDMREDLKVDRRSGLVKETRTIQWRVVRPPRGNLVQVFGVAKWCVGNPKPRISRVDVQERRRVVFIKAFMTTFRTPAKYESCPALEAGMKKKVMLSSPLLDRAIYDRGVTPSEKRWPRSRG